MNVTELRAADWNSTIRTADNTIATITRSGLTGLRNIVTSIVASYDDLTVTGDVGLYGLEVVNDAKGYVGPFDGTDANVVKLGTDIITVVGHGLTNGDKVVYHNGGGTSITNLTSGTMYFVVGVSGNDFQLSLTSGGAAINLAGTQASLGTAQYILKLAAQWYLLGQMEATFYVPLVGGVGAPLVLRLSASTNDNGLLNMSGYTRS